MARNDDGLPRSIYADHWGCRLGRPAGREPRLVYASISGFGQEGPWSARPGYDQVAQGMSWTVTRSPTVVPMGTFPAADGVVNLAPGTNVHFRAVCAVLGHPEWADDERYARPGARAKRRDEVNGIIGEVTGTQVADHWIERFMAEGVPAGPVLDLGQMFQHTQIRHLEMAQPIDHPTRGRVAVVSQPITFGDDPLVRGVRRAAPALGEHTDAILGELGLDNEKIAALRQAHVI